MTQNLEQLGDYIQGLVSDRVLSHHIALGELVLLTTPTHVVDLLTFLRDDEGCLFSQLIDVTAVSSIVMPDR